MIGMMVNLNDNNNTIARDLTSDFTKEGDFTKIEKLYRKRGGGRPIYGIKSLRPIVVYCECSAYY